jgi:hypothetical protein
MTEDDQKVLTRLFERYHSNCFEEWPKPYQIAFDIIWLSDLILKQEADLKALAVELGAAREKLNNRSKP